MGIKRRVKRAYICVYVLEIRKSHQARFGESNKALRCDLVMSAAPPVIASVLMVEHVDSEPVK